MLGAVEVSRACPGACAAAPEGRHCGAMDGPATGYEWADNCPDLDAFCVSVAVGSAPEAVAVAFSADPGGVRSGRFADQWDMKRPDGFGNDTVQIDTVGSAVVCVEANGWAGIDDDRARRLSQAGPYVALYRSVNADMDVVHARAGQVVRRFDPLLYEADGAIPEEDGLAFGVPGGPVSASLALIERLTGVRLTRAWLLEDTHPTFRRDPET
jgi:hypothetical protein